MEWFAWIVSPVCFVIGFLIGRFNGVSIASKIAAERESALRDMWPRR